MDQPGSTQLAEGWPAPPYWYACFPAEAPDRDTLEFAYDKTLFPPPPVPQDNFTAFGAVVDMSEFDMSTTLDSDAKLYREEGVELRDEFDRLFDTLLDEVVVLFGQSSQLNSEFAGGASGRVKNIIRLYRNLQNILHVLRQDQFTANVLDMLHQQAQQKLAIINDIRQIAFDLAPLTLEDAIRPPTDE
ncbi:MED7 protein [Gregarina niphandrodes]|uniref:Mediator of RNA polymerase II transcription subunit 7 n=1 Tax=Gregarina niphandrodes TaxID=110365 RepID=A0A023B1H0_GRENI|nr:MED7 protein [Gregarina niphandrodes]EZG47616.1 MED7 protein [Gregarina niphandrodes]|eukprot:XP_011132166.1 MED7 protein [Gregarina niphandrodes]